MSPNMYLYLYLGMTTVFVTHCNFNNIFLKSSDKEILPILNPYIIKLVQLFSLNNELTITIIFNKLIIAQNCVVATNLLAIYLSSYNNHCNISLQIK